MDYLNNHDSDNFLVKKALICCTVRTAEMFDRFLINCENRDLKTAVHSLKQTNLWYYVKIAEIVLIEVTVI